MSIKNIIGALLRLSAIVVAFPGVPAFAQLFVDNGGPRDIFFGTTADKDSIRGLSGKFDSTEKSASATYFGEPVPNAPFILAFKAKVTAADGVEEFLRFNNWPQTDFSLLGNYTGRFDSGNETYIWSVCPSATATYSELELIDPSLTATPKQVTKDDVFAGSFAITGALVFPWGDSIAMNGGIKRDDNYASLPSVIITGGKLPDGTAVSGVTGNSTAHEGKLSKYTSYPIYATYARVFSANWMAKVIPGIDQSSVYDLITAPYYKAAPASGSKPTRSFGLNLTVRALSNTIVGSDGQTKLSDGKKPNDQKLSFPYAFYVESSTDGKTGKQETKGGVAVIFKWQ